MSRHLNLQIPEPCSENWDEMQPRIGGRFCGSCSRTIADFTRMTDGELVAFIRKNKHSCGRFRADQLNRDLPLPKKAWPGVRYFFAITLPAFLLSLKGAAQQAASIATEMTPSRNAALSSAAKTATDTLPANRGARTISGKVVDRQGSPVPFASIMISGTTRGTTADEYGRFSFSGIELPSVLRISSVGFETAECRVTTENSDKPIKVQLAMTVQGFLGEIVVVRSKSRRVKAKKLPPAEIVATPSVLVYPNPAQSGSSLHLRLSHFDAGSYRVALFNLAGQRFLEEKFSLQPKQSELTIALPSVPAGNYLLRLVSEKTGRAITEQLVLRN